MKWLIEYWSLWKWKPLSFWSRCSLYMRDSFNDISRHIINQNKCHWNGCQYNCCHWRLYMITIKDSGFKIEKLARLSVFLMVCYTIEIFFVKMRNIMPLSTRKKWESGQLLDFKSWIFIVLVHIQIQMGKYCWQESSPEKTLKSHNVLLEVTNSCRISLGFSMMSLHGYLKKLPLNAQLL